MWHTWTSAPLINGILSDIGYFASLTAWRFLVHKVQGYPGTLLVMEMLRHGRNKKRGHCSHRSPFLSPMLCLPLKLIRFRYQAFFSYASLPLQHAWNCTALSIIYSLTLICLLFLMVAFVRALAALLPVIWCSSSSPSVLRHTSSAGLSPTHLLALVGELWIFFFPPLSPNDSTVRCYEAWVLMSWLCNAGGDALKHGGESEDRAGRDALAQGESEGPLWQYHPEVRRTRPHQWELSVSKVGHSAKLDSWQNAILTVFLLLFRHAVSRNCSQTGSEKTEVILRISPCTSCIMGCTIDTQQDQ